MRWVELSLGLAFGPGAVFSSTHAHLAFFFFRFFFLLGDVTAVDAVLLSLASLVLKSESDPETLEELELLLLRVLIARAEESAVMRTWLTGRLSNFFERNQVTSNAASPRALIG